MMAPTTALSPVAWLVSELTGPRTIEMTNKHDQPDEREEYPEKDYLGCSNVLLLGTTTKS
jgi:hypothetical protein